MQAIWVVRVFFILLSTLSGFWIGQPVGLGPHGSAGGLLISLFVVSLEYGTATVSSKKILVAAIGGFLGLAFSRLFHDTIPWPRTQDPLGHTALTISNLCFLYFGIVLALRHADRLTLSHLKFILTNPGDAPSLLDTSVIIDGRIRVLYELGFMQRRLLVPQFVLDELQLLADSRDIKRRSQGRRGLENLEALRKIHPLLEITEKDFPESREVDNKLILLARELGAAILTNDYNLEKVAQIHQIRVMNLNELAAALRPALHVGDEVSVGVLREGKDSNQGVGYLDDGTMVVIDDGLKFVGKTARVSVTSILHTSAGRMIFSRISTGAPQVPVAGAAGATAPGQPAPANPGGNPPTPTAGASAGTLASNGTATPMPNAAAAAVASSAPAAPVAGAGGART